MEWLFNPLYAALWWFATGVAGMFVWAGGLVLDKAVILTVYEMGTHINGNVGNAVRLAWTIVRDMFNLIFIFALIYIGLKIILNSSDSNARGHLVRLIIAALLINFSLFFTMAIVDFTNITAVKVFDMSANGVLQVSDEDGNAVTMGESGVAAYFMNIMALSEFLGKDSIEESQPSGTPATSLAFILIFMIFGVVAGIVFLAGGVMLIIRYASLMLYMIFSPMMFIGMIWPGAQSMTSQWWRGMLKNAFFAPAYFFMLFISAAILISGTGDFNAITGSLAGAVTQPDADNDSFSFILYYILAIIFLIASIVVSQRIGMAGANGSMNALQNARKRGQRMLGGATAGGAAYLGRNTVGVAANAAVNHKGFKRHMARMGTLGRQTYNTTAKVADSSFDARKLASKKVQSEIGEGRKGGITTIAKGRKDANEKFLKAIGTNEVSDAEKLKITEAAEKTALENPEYKALKQKEEEAKKAVIVAETQGKAEIKEAETKLNEAKSKLEEKQEELKKATESEQAEILRLGEELKSATTDEERQRINGEISALDAIVKTKQDSFSTQITSLTEAVQEAETNFTDTTNTVNTAVAEKNAIVTNHQKQADKQLASVKEKTVNLEIANRTYANQIKFNEQLAKEAERLRTGQSLLVSGGAMAGMAAGTLATGGIAGLAIGGAAGTVVGSRIGTTHIRQEEAKDGLNKYGADGLKKLKSDKKQKQAKDIAKQIQELAPAEKKDDEGDKKDS